MKETKAVDERYHVNNIILGMENIDRAKKEIKTVVTFCMRYVESVPLVESRLKLEPVQFEPCSADWCISADDQGPWLRYGPFRLYGNGRFNQVPTYNTLRIRQDLQKLLDLVRIHFPRIDYDLLPFADASALYWETGWEVRS